MSQIKHIFLDLDGTLFQSATDIRNAWISTLDELKMMCPRFNNLFRVGPSLTTMLHMLFPTIDEVTEKIVVSTFKRHYDTSLLPNTVPYPGIDEWLHELHAHGFRLYSMTNKRLHPTRMLIERYNWSRYFKGIISSDSFDIPHPTKTPILTAALKLYQLPPRESIMVGDTAEDIKAGQVARCITCACTWGYGNQEEIRLTFPDITMNYPNLSNLIDFNEGSPKNEHHGT